MHLFSKQHAELHFCFEVTTESVKFPDVNTAKVYY
jgi:hypothetical protein